MTVYNTTSYYRRSVNNINNNNFNDNLCWCATEKWKIGRRGDARSTPDVVAAGTEAPPMLFN